MSIYITGKSIVSLLYPLLKAVQVYDVNNDVVINSAKKFIDFMLIARKLRFGISGKNTVCQSGTDEFIAVLNFATLTKFSGRCQKKSWALNRNFFSGACL